VKGDAFLLRQAIDNLIENALDFSPRGGTIAVAAQASGGEVAIEVADDGPGVPGYALPECSNASTRCRVRRVAAAAAGWGCALSLKSRRCTVAAPGSQIATGQAHPLHWCCLLPETCHRPHSPERLRPGFVSAGRPGRLPE
jgi:K+-sensing histidine kinase KdpD